MELRKVALNEVHVSLGAKMVPFAGYNMPVRYSSDLDEHHTVRQAVGIFDVSHMGEFLVQGPGALDLIQRVTSNDAAKLSDGKVQYSCLPNEDGGIVDDLLVYRFGEEDYMLVVNASNIQKDWDWITNYNTQGVTLLRVALGELDARVIESDADGRPSTVDFSFAKRLDSTRYLFMCYRDGVLVPWRPPSLGGSERFAAQDFFEIIGREVAR